MTANFHNDINTTRSVSTYRDTLLAAITLKCQVGVSTTNLRLGIADLLFIPVECGGFSKRCAKYARCHNSLVDAAHSPCNIDRIRWGSSGDLNANSRSFSG